MHLLKYLFLFFVMLLTQKSFASCPYPATYEGIAYKPFQNTICYPENSPGTGYCEFKIIDNGLDIKVPCTSGNCSSQGYAIQLQSLSSKVYKNSDCTNPPIQDGCTQLPDGSIECEEPPDPASTTLECTTDSCPNPENKRCPNGYTTGSFNGQSICVKSKTENPEDPTQCTGEDCGIRTDRIVSAVNKANTDISTSIDNLSTVFDAPFESLKQYLSDISDKLSLLTDKIGNSGNTGTENPPDEQDVDTSQLQADVPFHQTDKQQISSNIFSSKSQCPQSSVLSLPKYGISYEFSFDQICSFLSLLSYFVMIIAYVTAAYIVVKA